MGLFDYRPSDQRLAKPDVPFANPNFYKDNNILPPEILSRLQQASTGFLTTSGVLPGTATANLHKQVTTPAYGVPTSQMVGPDHKNPADYQPLDMRASQTTMFGDQYFKPTVDQQLSTIKAKKQELNSISAPVTASNKRMSWLGGFF